MECPNCKAMIVDRAHFCPQCNYRFDLQNMKKSNTGINSAKFKYPVYGLVLIFVLFIMIKAFSGNNKNTIIDKLKNDNVIIDQYKLGTERTALKNIKPIEQYPLDKQPGPDGIDSFRTGRYFGTLKWWYINDITIGEQKTTFLGFHNDILEIIFNDYYDFDSFKDDQAKIRNSCRYAQLNEESTPSQTITNWGAITTANIGIKLRLSISEGPRKSTFAQITYFSPNNDNFRPWYDFTLTRLGGSKSENLNSNITIVEHPPQ